MNTYDSRGKQSRTLLFVGMAWVILLIKFLISGMTLPIVGTMTEMTAIEFGSAFALIMAPWLGREYTEKVKVDV